VVVTNTFVELFRSLRKSGERQLVEYSKAITRGMCPQAQAVLLATAVGGCSRAITCA